MQIIDADTHVIETEHTWEYMTEEEREFKPLVVVPKDRAAVPEGRDREYWLIGGRAYPKNAGIETGVSEGARVMSDIEERLAHMDRLGVDVHVLYPTLFLRPLTSRPEVELALCRAYNRWLAEIWKLGKNRLRWVALLPFMTLDKALEELHLAKENGACGIFMRSVEMDKLPADPYFYPLYQEAGRLKLPVCIHATVGNFSMWDLYTFGSGIARFKLPVVGAFHNLIMRRIPEKFPDVRWAFVEVSSQWVPYALNDTEIRMRRRGEKFSPSDLMKEYGMYVSCQTTDDLDYVLQYAGTENLIIGSDYGHNDTSSEIEALQKLKSRGELDPATVDKILSDNPKRLYAL